MNPAPLTDQSPAEPVSPGTVISEGEATRIIAGVSGYVAAPTPTRDCVLDGDFSIEELEAILWWLKNKPGVQFP